MISTQSSQLCVCVSCAVCIVCGECLVYFVGQPEPSMTNRGVVQAGKRYSQSADLLMHIKFHLTACLAGPANSKLTLGTWVIHATDLPGASHARLYRLHLVCVCVCCASFCCVGD